MSSPRLTFDDYALCSRLWISFTVFVFRRLTPVFTANPSEMRLVSATPIVRSTSRSAARKEENCHGATVSSTTFLASSDGSFTVKVPGSNDSREVSGLAVSGFTLAASRFKGLCVLPCVSVNADSGSNPEAKSAFTFLSMYVEGSDIVFSTKFPGARPQR